MSLPTSQMLKITVESWIPSAISRFLGGGDPTDGTIDSRKEGRKETPISAQPVAAICLRFGESVTVSILEPYLAVH